MILELLRDYFGCGWIRQSKSDRTFKYEARSVEDLLARIVPHFERHPLVGSKAQKLCWLSEVCKMVGQGDHLTREGLRKIITVATRSTSEAAVSEGRAPKGAQ